VEEEFRAMVEGAAEGATTQGAVIRTTLARQPFSIPPDHPFVVLVRDRAAPVLGGDPLLAGAFGWMDSALLAAADIPTVVFGPSGAGAHADEEWVDLPSLERTRDVLLAVAEAVCA
jgi:acetylornithine deacetylase